MHAAPVRAARHAAPRNHVRTYILAALAAFLAAALVTALGTGLVTIDHTHGTYGVSIGSDSRYCSLELNTDPHGGGIDLWCQRAG